MRFVAALVGIVALVDAHAAVTPPRPLGNLSNAVENCYRMHGRSGLLVGEVEVTVSVDAAGRATSATSPGGTPMILAVAAQCVAITMKFEPAMQDGNPVPGKLPINVGFPTPPELRIDARRAIEYCQPAIDPLVTLNAAYEGQLDLLVKVGKDGRVVETVLPEGVLPWMETAGKCVAEKLEFFPARLNLVAFESWASIPVDFNLSRNPHERARIDSPTMRSGESQILDAYRKCYPGGRDDQAEVIYRIKLSNGGRVRHAEVVRSSGDPALDSAGVCILRRLVFVPARRNGANVKSTLNWPILVRPPG